MPIKDITKMQFTIVSNNEKNSLSWWYGAKQKNEVQQMF